MSATGAVQTKQAVCCACHQQCSLMIQVEDNHVLRIQGNKHNPVTNGFACIKGIRANELHEHPDRIHQPLKRVGPRGGGKWEKIPWSRAVDEIAASIRRLAEKHGPETLAYSFGTFHGADWGIGQRFMNLFGSPNTVGQDKICYGPAALGEILTYGFGPSFFTFPVPGKTRCMVVWGLRPSASMPLLWKQILQVKRAGAKLIVIDPWKTRESHQADLWLQNRPGTDAALALGFMHWIINKGRHDAGFVEAHTVGFDQLREQVAPYTPEHVEELTSIPAGELGRAARMLADNSPFIIHAGNGLCQSGRGAVQTGRALACLVAITGNLGVEGGHVLTGPPHDLLANGDAFASEKLPLSQGGKRLGGERFPISGAGFNQLDEVVSGAWYGKRHILNWLNSAHEPTLWQAIIDRKPYPVTAVILQHHNPVGASADAGMAAEALCHSNLELLVAQDLFLTASSSLADYVLPAAHWLEKPFMTMGLGLLGIAGDFVECKPAPLAASDQHHSDYDLWRDLGHRLGQEEDWPESLERFWDSCLKPAGLDFTTLSSLPGPVFGDQACAKPSTIAPPGENIPEFGTPSGKIELRSSLLEGWGEDPLPAYERPPVVDASAGTYPLLLTTGGRCIEGFHQDAHQMPWFRRKFSKPLASLHPDTAARQGLQEGDWIWIETPAGRARQCLRLTDELQPGIVHADRWWYPERKNDPDDPFGWRSTNINVCTEGSAANCDSILGTWLLRGLPCRVSKASPPPTPSEE